MTISINCKILKLLFNDHILDRRSDSASSSHGELRVASNHRRYGRHLLISSEAFWKYSSRSTVKIYRNHGWHCKKEEKIFFKLLSLHAHTWLPMAQIRILTITFFPPFNYWAPEHKVFAMIHQVGFLSLVSYCTKSYWFFWTGELTENFLSILFVRMTNSSSHQYHS